MGDNHQVVKEELKEALRQELSAEPAPEEEAHGEEMEEMTEEPEPVRMTWEEFLATWRKSPFVFLEEGANKVLAERFKVEKELVGESAIVPALAYPVYWYLAPHLGAGGAEIPEPFRPLVRSVMVLSTAIIKSKVSGHAGQALPAPE